MDLTSLAQSALEASRLMSIASTKEKNEALEKIGEALLANSGEILAANQADLDYAHSKGKNEILDRLSLDKSRLEGIVEDLQKVIMLEDEIGKIIDEQVRPNGLKIQRVRCPLGVVGMIYESRPNVTVDATVLCLKSGNAVILKGGSDAILTNRALVKVMKGALLKSAISAQSLQFLDTTDRAITGEFLKLKGYLDVIIPRGGKGLIDFVIQNATVPVIETGASVVHTYIDKVVNIEMAVAIVVNAKTRRVSICNALDTILVHEKIAQEFLTILAPLLREKEVELRCDERALAIVGGDGVAATDHDFGKEFLDYILAVKVVDDFDEALKHIAKYSLKHSEAIITEDAKVGERFLNEVDAACVYWNASTQFSDGAQFGLGAEIGISTQKLHVRGPFALEGLTTFKWVVRGDGQVRI
ncbi:TPA: glutamate-5-semialdehyde dehydrogenase [Candidatus Peregrinibacteria bacterium]|nr:glutamate-5-semialdehyde dehydrogenase [Candidatus Peregrinibacteria bacterium]